MDFLKARKKARRIRQERAFLFIYAVAVTLALIIAVKNNNSVQASVPANSQVAEDLPEEFYDAETETLTEEVESESLSEEEPSPEDSLQSEDKAVINEDIITVEAGDNFNGILTGLGLTYGEATKIYQTFKKMYDARNLRAGQKLYVTTYKENPESEEVLLLKLMVEPVSGTRHFVEKNDDGDYETRTEQDTLQTNIKTLSGTIQGNVSVSMKNAGVPQNIIGNFIAVFAFSVDFRRDVHAGDKFEVKYEELSAPDGKIIKTGDVIYAALELSKTKTALYRFKDSSGVAEYYDENGLALKKTLNKKPMEFQKARISSYFGRRFHPILKKYHTHTGVDYAAPMGTKVYASADGTVTTAKWVNGYGNYITIRHNGEYSTGYGHLKSYAKGIRPGVRVKQGQVIAYVGSTGRSTGPHLHFEVMRNGQKIDPLKVKAATGENLSGSKLAAFKKVVAEIKSASDGAQTATVAAK